MCQKRLWFFGAAYFSLLIILTLSFAILITAWDTPETLVFYALFQFLIIGIAYEYVELLAALLSPPRRLPCRDSLPDSPAVALLMTTCNDAVPTLLARLHHQHYPNYTVFILDDSTDPRQRQLIDASGHQVMRRTDRRAYKAGNLNHWLDRYGAYYRYAVILDSDSSIESDFVETMVRYAEHDANRTVAIFQSKITNRHTSASFSRAMGTLAPLRMDVLERVHNNLDMLFSFGHNNLLRLSAIRVIGGSQSISVRKIPHRLCC